MGALASISIPRCDWIALIGSLRRSINANYGLNDLNSYQWLLGRPRMDEISTIFRHFSGIFQMVRRPWHVVAGRAASLDGCTGGLVVI